MLSFTVTHRDNVNAKIHAPNMAAPQTDAYLALRHMQISGGYRMAKSPSVYRYIMIHIGKIDRVRRTCCVALPTSIRITKLQIP